MVVCCQLPLSFTFRVVFGWKQFRRLAAWKSGCPNCALASAKPMIRAVTLALVWGASPMTSSPIRSSLVSAL